MEGMKEPFRSVLKGTNLEKVGIIGGGEVGGRGGSWL